MGSKIRAVSREINLQHCRETQPHFISSSCCKQCSSSDSRRHSQLQPAYAHTQDINKTHMLHKVSPRTQRGCSGKWKIELGKKRLAVETKSGVGEKRKDDGEMETGPWEGVCLSQETGGGGGLVRVSLPLLSKGLLTCHCHCVPLCWTAKILSLRTEHTHIHTHTTK